VDGRRLATNGRKAPHVAHDDELLGLAAICSAPHSLPIKPPITLSKQKLTGVRIFGAHGTKEQVDGSMRHHH
jgi:hypothetical protein